MPTIDILKEQEAPPTPLFLFDCVLSSGATERWATHAVTFGGNAYGARLLKHNLFQLRASSDDGLDGTATISVTLANADSHFSQIERETGFKGAQVTIQFLFFDLVANGAASEARVVFRGVANSADEITESAFRVSFNNRLESAENRAAGSADSAAMPVDVSIDTGAAARGDGRRREGQIFVVVQMRIFARTSRAA